MNTKYETDAIALIRGIRHLESDLRGVDHPEFRSPAEYPDGIAFSIVELLRDAEAKLMRATNHLIRTRTGEDPGWEFADEEDTLITVSDNIVAFVDGTAIYRSEIEDVPGTYDDISQFWQGVGDAAARREGGDT